MISKIYNFLQRDKDISFHDEFKYICITFKELIQVIKTGNK